MNIRFTVLGREMFQLAITARTQAEDDDTPTGITGGGGHNFERSYETPDMDDRFGFHSGNTRG